MSTVGHCSADYSDGNFDVYFGSYSDDSIFGGYSDNSPCALDPLT